MGKPFTHLHPHRLVEGPVVALAGGAAVLEVDFDVNYRHSFAGVEFFDDAEGTSPVPATGGTVSFTLNVPVLPNDPQSFVNSNVNAVDAEVVSWAANTTKVTATLTGITGTATHACLRASGNIS